jgi:mono/diheme cytochrome c family protein
MRTLTAWLLVASAAAVAAEGPKRPTDEQRGKELYERHCVACHGATAAGDGPATAALVAEVPNLSGNVKTDKATIDLVRFGRGPMPAFEASFEGDDARRVLQHMARLHEQADKPAPEPAPAAEPVDEAPEEAEGPG